MKKRSLYWIVQIIGWSSYTFLVILWNLAIGTVSKSAILLFVFFAITGIILSHLYRRLSIRLKLRRLNLLKQILIVFVSSIILASLTSVVLALFSDFFLLDIPPILVYPFSNVFYFLIFSTPVFLFWNLFYYSYHYVINYKNEQYKNLQLQSISNEIELNNLKSQLNPHFMFNAMNSIRALVDENPSQAKKSVTQLSQLLRNTLLMSKEKFVNFEKELSVVKDYLAIEKIRYEERLRCKSNIEKGVENILFPPLMLQTLVENAVKHSISKSTNGGLVEVTAKKENQKLVVTVENKGKITKDKGRKGLGLENIKKRLKILYTDKAKFTISEINSKVVSRIEIPAS